MIKAVLFNVILLAGFYCHGQYRSSVAGLDSSFYLRNLDSLMVHWGTGKVFEPVSKPAAIAALTFYPELKETRIEFRRFRIRTTMSAIPALKTSGMSRKNRTYIININNNKRFAGIRFDSLSFDEQVGLIGHELGHILYYESKSATGILLFGLGYAFRDFRKHAEAATDATAINHQMGWLLYKYVLNLEHNPVVSAAYRRFKSRIYLNSNELKTLIIEHETQLFK